MSIQKKSKIGKREVQLKYNLMEPETSDCGNGLVGSGSNGPKGKGNAPKISRCYLLDANFIIAFVGQTGSYFLWNGIKYSLVENHESIVYWQYVQPFIFTFHKNNEIQLYHVGEHIQFRRKWECAEECHGMVFSGSKLILAMMSCIEFYAVSYKPLKSTKISLKKIETHTTSIAEKKLHIFKANEQLFVCGINQTIHVYDLETLKPLITTKSKDGSYFLNAELFGLKTVCATATSLYLSSFEKGHGFSVIIPIKSPVSYFLFHHNKLVCGCFDGSIKVFDTANMGTHLYDINNTQPIHAPDGSYIATPRVDTPIINRRKTKCVADDDQLSGTGFTVGHRIMSLAIFNDFLISSSKNGKCSIWSLNTKYQTSPLVKLLLQEGECIQEIQSEGSSITLLVRDEENLCFGYSSFRPRLDKLNRILNECLLMQYIAIPKTGKKAIFNEWRSSTKKGMVNEDFIRLIQYYAEKEYPYLMNCCESCTITNNLLPDNPIVFVNDAFVEMTGYSREDIYGKNCRFLQGRYTDVETVTKIRESLKIGKTVSVQILNYRKDGAPFWNVFVILPVHDDKGKVPAFLAIQKNITAIKLNEIPVIDWLAHEVALWFERIGYAIYSQIMMSKQIIGRKLLNITAQEFIELGLSKQDSETIRGYVNKLEESGYFQEDEFKGLLTRRKTHKIVNGSASSDSGKTQRESSDDLTDTSTDSNEASWESLFKKRVLLKTQHQKSVH